MPLSSNATNAQYITLGSCTTVLLQTGFSSSNQQTVFDIPLNYKHVFNKIVVFHALTDIISKIVKICVHLQ